MFVPDDNGKTFYIHIHKYIIQSLVFFIVIFVIGIIALLLRSGEIGTKLQLTYSLLHENRRLSEENRKLQSIVHKIESMENLSIYLRRLASSVGEVGLESSLAGMSFDGKETLLEEDSVDVYLDNNMSDNSDIYQSIQTKTSSRQELSVSIPNISPVEGWITKKFIKNLSSPLDNHLGIDFAAKEGSLLRSTAPGIIVKIINDKYYGLQVTVKHKFGFETSYGHCMQILVAKGDHVQRGQTVALLGNTGRSSAPHVHYEILKDGKNIDPLKYIFDRLE